MFSERVNKINKPLAKLIKRKGERIQINKIKHERRYITTDTEKTQSQKIKPEFIMGRQQYI